MRGTPPLQFRDQGSPLLDAIGGSHSPPAPALPPQARNKSPTTDAGIQVNNNLHNKPPQQQRNTPHRNSYNEQNREELYDNRRQQESRPQDNRGAPNRRGSGPQNYPQQHPQQQHQQNYSQQQQNYSQQNYNHPRRVYWKCSCRFMAT